MITEKAIRDSAWCTMLWRETEGNKKREKPDRKYSETTLEDLYAALTTGRHNKKVLINKTQFGHKAEPFEKDIWFVAETDHVNVLLSVQEVRLEKEVNGPWTVYIRRNQSKKPGNPDTQEAEEMTRRIIYAEFKKFFPRQNIIVETKYEGDPLPMVTQPTDQEVEAAHTYMDKIRGVAAGEVNLVARFERCSVCWWKACPARQQDEAAEGPRSGKPAINIL